MCGIAGTAGPGASDRVSAMLQLLRHRGPDDEGLFHDPVGNVAIGATRLSVIDLAGGHQPLTNEDATVVAVLNGEIYNFRSLRASLESRGHTFRTGTDTEVLVHLYEEHGPALVHALDGMYAFAIWDTNSRTLLLGRDRFGEKPLFVHTAGGGIAFASEVAALRSGLAERPVEIDAVALDLFFKFGYIPGQRTLFHGIEQLPPGTVGEWHAGGPLRVSSYWSSPEHPEHATNEGLVEETLALLTRAVETRMVADVPVGVFLSGGVDSSLVAALAARCAGSQLSTFSVGYDVGGVSETEQARAVADAIGTRHHAFTLGLTDVSSTTARLLGALDQPVADPAFVALGALSEYAREHVTVALGGEGADEVFGGYPRYRWISRLPRSQPSPVLARSLSRVGGGRPRVDRLARALAATNEVGAHVEWVTGNRVELGESLYGDALRDASPGRSPGATLADGFSRNGGSRADFLMRLDARTWLPDDVLAKADRASMLASLELRAPFLARELVEFAASVPTSAHLAGGGKHLLREALAHVLPGLGGRRRKVAFRVPLAEWLRGPLLPILENQLDGGWLYTQGWFDARSVKHLVREHASCAADHAPTLWPLFALGSWDPA